MKQRNEAGGSIISTTKKTQMKQDQLKDVSYLLAIFSRCFVTPPQKSDIGEIGCNFSAFQRSSGLLEEIISSRPAQHRIFLQMRTAQSRAENPYRGTLEKKWPTKAYVDA